MTDKVVGLMGGGGTGPELINAVLPCFKAVQALYGAKFEFMRFDDEKWEYESKTEVWNRPFYDAMCLFYDNVKERNGCILRGAVQAPVLYKVREYVGHHFKINPILGIPELADLTRFSADALDGLRLLLVRNNTFGFFHCDGKHEESTGNALARIEHFQEEVEQLVRYAFKLAPSEGTVTLAMPTRKLGAIGALWERICEKVAADYPTLTYTRIEPCLEEIGHYVRTRKNKKDISRWYDTPHCSFDVIFGPELFMDYLQDDVTWMIHGEPYIGCSANFSPDDFSSFQTVHGTVNPFSGKNIINPIGMVHAVAMCLEYAFDMPQAAQDIERSVRQTLTMGFRTHDIYRGNPKYTLVGTREMVDKVVSELYALHA